LRRADHSFKGVLPIVCVKLFALYEPQPSGAQAWVAAPQNKNSNRISSTYLNSRFRKANLFSQAFPRKDVWIMRPLELWNEKKYLET